MAYVVEHLPSIQEALGSILSTKNKISVGFMCYFSYHSTRFMCLGVEDHRDKVQFLSITSRAGTVNILYLLDVITLVGT
jgi:hypothetical protein